MKFKIKKNVLLEALNNVSKALSSKNIIPILSGIKFELFDDKLVLTASDNDITIQSIIKNESPFDLNIFTSELYFRLLLSIKGSKIRNIRSAKGFGYSKFLTLLQNGIRDNVILQDLKSLDSIIKLFPEKYQEEIKEAFQCTDINTQSRLINQADIDDIKSQIIDKIDIESVEALNNKRFFNYPINITSLI